MMNLYLVLLMVDEFILHCVSKRRPQHFQL